MLTRRFSLGPPGELWSSARRLAAEKGIRPASIHDLYLAMGRGEVGGFTVPAINVRMMTYDTTRAIFRAAKARNAGAILIDPETGVRHGASDPRSDGLAAGF